MLSACPMVISQTNYTEIFEFAEKNSALAKKLYNAALFRIRQIFMGWDRTSRPDPMENVFQEIEQTKAAYPSLKFTRVIKYRALEKLLRVTENPDFFAGLPMQTAQAVVRRAVDDFANWLKSLKKYKADPSGYTGRPRMPKYCRTEHKTFTVTNQDAVLYRGGPSDGCLLKLPGFKRGHHFPLGFLSSKTRLKEVSFKPYYGKYIMTFVIEDMAPPFFPDMPNFGGLDLGTDNIAAIAYTDRTSVVYKGGAVLSANQLFAKERASAVSAITGGHEHKRADSAHLDRISLYHDCFVKDQLHKISTDIVRRCVEHRAGVLVIGANKMQKQGINIGRRNNQKFVAIPHQKLRWMITYKALIAGIFVIEREESYTSKADITAGDRMPVYGDGTPVPRFSGRRIERGSYWYRNGLVVNADCHGAANILRKEFPHVWDGVDFGFLATPMSVGFKDLNPKYRTA